jgi:hypothetical protein
MINEFNIVDLDRQIILVSNDSLSSSDSDPKQDLPNPLHVLEIEIKEGY